MIPIQFFAAEHPQYIWNAAPALQVPIAELTSYGEDGNSRRRIDHLCSNWVRIKSAKLKKHILENELVHGFRFSSYIEDPRYDIKDQKILVEDPRGFNVRISSHNAAELMLHGNIERGEIVDRCVWIQDKRSMSLVVENSPRHLEAVRVTKLSQQKVSVSDCAPGDLITLQSGEDVLYLGLYHFMSCKKDRYSYRSSSEKVRIGVASKRHMYLHPDLTQFTDDRDIVTLANGTDTPTLPNGVKFGGHPVLTAANLKVADIRVKSKALVDTTRVAQALTKTTRRSLAQIVKVDLAYYVEHVSAEPYGTITVGVEKIDKRPTEEGSTYCWFSGSNLYALNVGWRSRSSYMLDLSELLVSEPGKEIELPYVPQQPLIQPTEYYQLVINTAVGSIPVPTIE